MKTKNIKIFGPAPTACVNAIKKVESILPLKRHILLFWDDCSTLGRIETCTSFLRQHSNFSKNCDVTAFQFKLFPNSVPFISSDRIVALEMPVSLSELLDYSDKDEIKLSIVVEHIENTLKSLFLLYRKESLGKEAHDKPAARQLWQGELEICEKGKPLKPSVLFVDDRIGCEGEGYEYLKKAGKKLSGMGFKVYGAKEVPFSKTDMVYKLDANGIFTTDSSWTKNDIADIDLFFLDIVEMSNDESETEDPIRLSGIQRDLLRLTQERSVLPFPQIYMLSHVGRESIAHICLANGADYYLEKNELLLDAPRPLAAILQNTANMRSIANVIADNLFAENPEKTAYLLYSQKHYIEKFDSLPEFLGGLSGSKVYLVQPVGSYGKQRPRVMKVAGIHQMTSELYAYKKYIEPYVDRGFARVENNRLLFEKSNKAVISYEYIGSLDNDKINENSFLELKDAFIQKRIDEIFTILNVLFSNLSILHEKKFEKKNPWDVLKFFRRELGSNVIENWDETGEENFLYEIILSNGRDGALVAISSPQKSLESLETWWVKNPEACLGPGFLIRPGKKFNSKGPKFSSESPFISVLNALDIIIAKETDDDRLTNLRKKSRLFIEQFQLDKKILDLTKETLDSVEIEPWGIAHCDLHSENVFVNNTDSLIIDYGKTREAPPAIDFVVLECDVRLRFLVKILSGTLSDMMDKPSDWLSKLHEFIVEFEKSLETESIENRNETPLSQNNYNLYKKFSKSIKHLRCLSFEGIYAGKEISYYRVLFLYLIRVLQYYRGVAGGKKGPVGTLWAAILANHIYETKLSAD